jgi:hypothetical protein
MRSRGKVWGGGVFLGVILGVMLLAAPVLAQQAPQQPPPAQNPPSSQGSPTPPSTQNGQQAPSSQNGQQPASSSSGQKPATDSGAQDASKAAGQGQAQNGNQGQANPNAKPGEEGTSNDRLFFALPNFLTLENEKQVPGYGQGAEGYAKRYGSYFADGTIENFMTSAVLASLLRQDPRFYQESQGGFWHRAYYAMSRIFVTRTDAGGQQFNYSEILGSASAAGISTYSYHPHADRNIGNTAKVWGTQVGYDTITIEIKEFWPDIRKKFAHKPHGDIDANLR